MAFAITDSNNFVIRDGLAYTEDRVLIYRLFFYDLPGETTPEIAGALRRYFSQFGGVIEIEFSNKLQRLQDRVDFVSSGKVTYVEAHYVPRVLMQAVHELPLRTGQFLAFRLKACFSWEQPYALQIKPYIYKLHRYERRQQVGFLALNNDVLASIFERLNLKDRLSFAMTCRRLAHVFVSYFERAYQTVRVSDMQQLTLYEQKSFFELMGRSFQIFKGQVPLQVAVFVMTFISENCPNLKILKLTRTYVKSHKMSRLWDNLPNLREISLNDCRLDDWVIRPMKCLTMLEKLSVKCNRKLTGAYMSEIPNLKCLYLHDCVRIAPRCLLEVCYYHKLRELDISHCDQLDNVHLRILGNQDQLEVLKLKGDIDFSPIFRLPSLKYLQMHTINYTQSVVEVFFKALSQKVQLEHLKLYSPHEITPQRAQQISCLHNLRELQLPNNRHLDDISLGYFESLKCLELLNISNTSVTDEGAFQLLCCCTHLKHLELELCGMITNQFYRSAVEILETRCTEKSALKVKAYGSSIQQHDWEQFEHPGKLLLKLYLDSPPPMRPRIRFVFLQDYSDSEGEN